MGGSIGTTGTTTLGFEGSPAQAYGSRSASRRLLGVALRICCEPALSFAIRAARVVVKRP
jgi:hypothetical protein